MELQKIDKHNLGLFVQNLINNFQVEGVKRKGQSVYGKSFFYETLNASDELCLDFDCTTMPPKKYFLPPKEELLKFTIGPKPEVAEVIESIPLIIFGVHPYDLKAISQMDKIFSEGNPDPNYLKRREGILLIGVDPTKVSPRSFWSSMEAASVSSGFDLMLTDLGESYLVEVGTDKGDNLLKNYAKVIPATKEEERKRIDIRSKLSDLGKKRGLNFPMRELPSLLLNSLDSPLWEEKASKCLSCVTCNMVCPTCYCFDVWDDMELDLTHGKRLRGWDGCLSSDFAKVATGENFRESRVARYRHRFFRKGQYLFSKLNDAACVGCGRCAAYCLPDIADPVEVFNRLKEDVK
ncbi:MAG TPA: 4Fe-4S dicluster domain-containing protein [Thermodesulfobacteriota bacterium]|nr:4Fe-4S dicluster domain-containing protein [Thermodesulfobacteriota bacterium]